MLSQSLLEGVQGRLWARDGREHVCIRQDRSPEHDAIDNRLNIGCVMSLTGTYRDLHWGKTYAFEEVAKATSGHIAGHVREEASY